MIGGRMRTRLDDALGCPAPRSTVGMRTRMKPRQVTLFVLAGLLPLFISAQDSAQRRGLERQIRGVDYTPCLIQSALGKSDALRTLLRDQISARPGASVPEKQAVLRAQALVTLIETRLKVGKTEEAISFGERLNDLVQLLGDPFESLGAALFNLLNWLHLDLVLQNGGKAGLSILASDLPVNADIPGFASVALTGSGFLVFSRRDDCSWNIEMSAIDYDVDMELALPPVINGTTFGLIIPATARLTSGNRSFSAILDLSTFTADWRDLTLDIEIVFGDGGISLPVNGGGTIIIPPSLHTAFVDLVVDRYSFDSAFVLCADPIEVTGLSFDPPIAIPGLPGDGDTIADAIEAALPALAGCSNPDPLVPAICELAECSVAIVEYDSSVAMRLLKLLDNRPVPPILQDEGVARFINNVTNEIIRQKPFAKCFADEPAANSPNAMFQIVTLALELLFRSEGSATRIEHVNETKVPAFQGGKCTHIPIELCSWGIMLVPGNDAESILINGFREAGQDIPAKFVGEWRNARRGTLRGFLRRHEVGHLLIHRVAMDATCRHFPDAAKQPVTGRPRHFQCNGDGQVKANNELLALMNTETPVGRFFNETTKRHDEYDSGIPRDSFSVVRSGDEELARAKGLGLMMVDVFAANPDALTQQDAEIMTNQLNGNLTRFIDCKEIPLRLR